MTREEYSELFHNEQLNLVAFKQLFHCDQEVLRLVNAAIAAEREACANACEDVHAGKYDAPEFWREGVAYTCAAAIRARSKS